jgi:SAM-dependent methyltransferase
MWKTQNNSITEDILPQILDVTSGFRNMWVNKNDPDTLYCDVRTNRELKLASETYGKQKNGKGGREYKAKVPTMAASYCMLPFQDETFNLINCDPPHLYRLGKTSLSRKKYGGLQIGTWQLELKSMAKELWRVLSPGGTLTFKWCDRDVPHKEVLRLYPVKARYGQFTAHGKNTSTLWCTFYKRKVI